ncbi:MAG: 2-oxoacid:ferredoxin oxidoreductase subunit beta [Gammaproteobacteria bacterium]|nr:2-oxoacid:ferredoxin oxidoreductase subunit beta [Gammaproteobacteria bacterium]MDE2250619.1 2-oxoacid:ferredoxin oxidoreductase subunit beta [Gammaproteobacteria bacterium]
MSFMPKPKVAHPDLPKNARGLTRRAYEGSNSTLCAGCGHDSITAAIVEACWANEVEPRTLVKLSGIGCSSKTTAYFVSGSHGFNSVHGRMPSVATGANAANRQLTYIGVSGDGDTLSIGLGQFIHAIRRNLNMVYIIENNGVYGLTKGQFSASADIGTTAKKGEVNNQAPIDPVQLALTLGASFVARSFSGDKAQLVPLIQAAMHHNGFALIDVLSPCVTFNDHEGSTRSYAYSREHYEEAVHADFVAPAGEIRVQYGAGESLPVTLHDGSRIVLRKVDAGYDPTDRGAALARIRERLREQEYLTGLLHISTSQPEFHAQNATPDQPLNQVPFATLNPGSATLAKILSRYR